MMNNLDKIEGDFKALPMPTGTLQEIGTELLRRCAERETRLSELAIECERAGDHDGTWIAMAARAQNNRLIARIEKDLTLCAATKPDDGTTLGRVEPSVSAPLVEDGRNSSL